MCELNDGGKQTNKQNKKKSVNFVQTYRNKVFFLLSLLSMFLWRSGRGGQGGVKGKQGMTCQGTAGDRVRFCCKRSGTVQWWLVISRELRRRRWNDVSFDKWNKVLYLHDFLYFRQADIYDRVYWVYVRKQLFNDDNEKQNCLYPLCI